MATGTDVTPGEWGQVHGVQNVGWYRFRLGVFEGTVVSDGYIHHSYEGFYPDADPAEIARLKSVHRLPIDHIPMDINPVVMNTGDRLFLIDAGAGRTLTWRGDMGRLIDNLGAAGIDPKDIDAVLMTHLHPDHAYGLIHPDGSATFPNAKLFCTDREWAEWTDPENLNRNDFRSEWTGGALEAVAPYRDRLRLFSVGETLFPGVSTFSVAGHTAGMCAYIFESEGQKMVFTGDVCHHQVYDLAHPEWYFHMDYDTNPQQAADAKTAIFAKVVTEGIRYHGYHFPFPGIGDVVPLGDGTYHFHPEAVAPRH